MKVDINLSITNGRGISASAGAFDKTGNYVVCTKVANANQLQHCKANAVKLMAKSVVCELIDSLEPEL